MIIKAKAKHIGFIAALLQSKNSDFYPLFKRMAAASPSGIPQDMEAELEVDVLENELVSIMHELTRAPEGISMELNSQLKTMLMAQIGIKLIAEGNQPETVLDGDGNPVMVPNGVDGELVPLTRPKQWKRVQLALGAMITANNTKVAKMIEDGWKYLKS